MELEIVIFFNIVRKIKKIIISKLATFFNGQSRWLKVHLAIP